ncbi:UNVERIFIED_CONTAM: hypothetical protein RMT77_019697 [Armadillidium vulgare]
MLQILLYILIGICSFVFISGLIYRKVSGVCTCTNQLTGKTVIVTGASAGVGKEAAFDFAQRGARVILACRNMEKAEIVKDWIVSSTGNKNVICHHLELSDLDSVRKFAKETIQREKRIDILVNNAGTFSGARQLSKQGYELTLATNHYGHFLLTILLLDIIVKSAPSRIINVSSLNHKFPGFDLDDLHFERRTYGSVAAYRQTKLCNVLFTNELARRLTEKGIENVSVNSLTPGVVKTEIYNKEGTFWLWLFSRVLHRAAKSEKLGAQTTIHVAVSDEGGKVSGEYFVDCKIAPTSQRAKDENLARELWRVTEEEVGLTDKEKYF